MKVKTSVSLSAELLRELDDLVGDTRSRSAAIEQAVRSYVDRRRMEEQSRRDLEIIDTHADRLNAEALDVLDYQHDV